VLLTYLCEVALVPPATQSAHTFVLSYAAQRLRMPVAVTFVGGCSTTPVVRSSTE
jgi:hypothetical protein